LTAAEQAVSDAKRAADDDHSATRAALRRATSELDDANRELARAQSTIGDWYCCCLLFVAFSFLFDVVVVVVKCDLFSFCYCCRLTCDFSKTTNQLYRQAKFNAVNDSLGGALEDERAATARALARCETLDEVLFFRRVSEIICQL
jgi:hypothetical protein